MGLFDKAIASAKNIGGGIAQEAAKIGSNVGVAVQDNSEIAGIKQQINAIDQELTASYAQIGRKFVDYVLETGDMPGIDVSDILILVDPKITQKRELEERLIELEKKIKDQNVLRERQQAEAEFNAEKAKLDKALGMDVISQDEYNIKLSVAQKKFNNFAEIRRVQKQYEMNLITKEEMNVKIDSLTH